MRNVFLLLILFAFCFAKCNKDKIESNFLPPATQEGKNTFAFILEGQVWTPKGFYGTPNLSLYYDMGLSGGIFNLSAYRKIDSGKLQVITLMGDSIQEPRKIILPDKNKFTFSFVNDLSNCRYDSSDSTTTIIAGYFDLKKLDKVNHIFSGEFEISFKKTGCKDVQISQGRFDMKY